jgi:hypothetical protein
MRSTSSCTPSGAAVVAVESAMWAGTVIYE